MLINRTLSLISFCLVFSLSITAQISLPPLFTDQSVNSGLNTVVGFEFGPNGKIYCWEKRGFVFVLDSNGVKQPPALLNISEEVGLWVDHGLNGFALDPDFMHNGYFYLYYTVDRHHLLNYGTPNYNATANEYYAATIARVTRYQADSATNFTTVVPNSRYVLIGTTKQNGIPVLHLSHSGGSLCFGTDSSLLISTGDGAAYIGIDTGYSVNSYWSQALTDSIIRPEENVGSFRSLMYNSLNGKILRVNRFTGEALETNPFYDFNHPDWPQSKVWCLGLRNPFRISVRPGSGSTDITAGDPGVILIGDVGWSTWEDLNISRSGGENFGWPLFEGLTSQNQYENAETENRDVRNPLFGIGGCTMEFLRFKDLLVQATKDPTFYFSNPCDINQALPADFPTSQHTRPQMDWRHNLVTTRVPTFTGYNATYAYIDSAGSPVTGTEFMGNASVAGTWYSGTGFPYPYQNAYYHADYGGQWIKKFKIGSKNNIAYVDSFASNIGPVVFLAQGKYDGCLWYVKYQNEIRKICFGGVVNNPPDAEILATPIYGASPLVVDFNSSLSTDPENMPLSFDWKFGDGDSSNIDNVQHIFTDTTGGSPQFFYTKLTVTDNVGNTDTDSVLISLNNTPPVVKITDPSNGAIFSNLSQSLFSLTANVTDAEHSGSQLHYNWQVSLEHNNHSHPNPPDSAVSTYLITDPTGCDDYFRYQIILTVTDDGGLFGSDTVNIFPDCPSPLAGFTVSSTKVCEGQPVLFVDTSYYAADWYWEFPGGTPSTSIDQSPTVYFNTAGIYDVTLKVKNPYGVADSVIKSGYIIVDALPVINLTSSTPDSVCASQQVILYANCPGNNYYQWYKDTVIIAGQNADSVISAGKGTYMVVVTNSNACSSIQTKTLYPKLPKATIVSQPLPHCFGDSVLLYVDEGDFYDNFIWKKGGQILSTNNDTIYAKKDGGYFVTASNTAGCSKKSLKTMIDLLPNIFISTSGPLTFCNGDSVVLTATYFTGQTYEWKRNGVLIPGANTNVYTAKTGGNYAVVVTNGTCQSQSPVKKVIINCKTSANNPLISELFIKPNPVHQHSEVLFSLESEDDLVMSIYEINGSLIYKSDYKFFEGGQNQWPFDTKALQPGVYVLKLANKNNVVKVTRFVKADDK